MVDRDSHDREWIAQFEQSRSTRRTCRRLDRGRDVEFEVYWTQSRLPPETATVTVRSGSAVLHRRFEPDDDLGANYEPVAFVGPDRPENLGESDLAWLTLHGAEGIRFLGADDSDLALIGWSTGWPLPAGRLGASAADERRGRHRPG